MSGADSKGVEKAKEAFNLIIGLAETFRNGTFDDKQEALSALGSNLILNDKKLTITNMELFSVIEKGLLDSKAINPMFEPRNIVDTSSRNEVFASVFYRQLRGLAAVRTAYIEEKCAERRRLMDRSSSSD